MVSAVASLLPKTQAIQVLGRHTTQSRITAELPPVLQHPALTDECPSILANGSGDSLMVNSNLSSIEVEAILREKVHLKLMPLQQAFKNYDVHLNTSVTKGEFRRVLELYCLPLTTGQFTSVLAKVEKNSNGTVKYCDFLDKFYGGKTFSELENKNRHSTYKSKSLPVIPSDINTDMLEALIRDKVVNNAKNLIRAFRLFDCNRDGKIQRHELRRVLDNSCFKLTDQQFDKLWQRHDFHHTGVINYNDFLKRIGVLVTPKTLNENSVRASLLWSEAEAKRKEQVQMSHQEHMTHEKLKGIPFESIDGEFRRLMRVNYLDIKRACVLVDRHLDGWMKIEDLRHLLSQFTVPLTPQLFTQITDRLGIKASSQVKWEHFLEKFQAPREVGNGQTLPIKPNHKFFPLRGGDEILNADQILKKLEEHVNSNFASIKEAFLQFDNNRDSLITYGELRRVIEKFTFRLSDLQFKELMKIVDPQHIGRISYHSFLDLFERKESLAGHKWLNSVHRVNDANKPAVLAWKTIEDIMREKIEYNWKDVWSELVRYDPFGSSTISTNQLRSLIGRYAVPMSDDHFEFLLAQYRGMLGENEVGQAQGRVNYNQFLDMLSVTVNPGDIHGLSHQIQAGSEMTKEKHDADIQNRHAQIVIHAADRVKYMSAQDVMQALKDRMSQHDINIRKSFLMYTNNNRSKITRKAFRDGLASFGMYLTDENFNELSSILAFDNGPLDYYDFVDKFDVPALELSRGVEGHPSNHRVNEIRGQQFGGMSALEAETFMRRKLRENFNGLRQAFYKMDTDHDGIISMSNFRALLDLFMVDIGNEEFRKLCERFDITGKSKITYREFLDRFEVREGLCGNNVLLSNQKPYEHKPTPLLTADEVLQVLCGRIYDQWHTLAQAFLTIDKGGNGVIKRRQLRRLLHHFSLHVSAEEFKKLWSTLDAEGQGYVSSDEFMARIGGPEYGASDRRGVSERIIEESGQNLDGHQQDQQMKHDLITVNQALVGHGLKADAVLQDLRDKIRDNYADFYVAFRKYDTKGRGRLTLNDVQQALVDQHYFLNENEIYRLLDLLGLKADNKHLDYDLFLKAFEEGRKSSYGKRERGEVKIVDYRGLSNEKAEAKMGEKVFCQHEALRKAFAVFDRHNAGKLNQDEFRRVLDLFCFKLTDSQYRHVLQQTGIGSSDRLIDYCAFLDQYAPQTERSEKWITSMQKAVNPPMSPAYPQLLQPMPLHDMLERLRDSVVVHFYNLAQDFAEVDYAKIDVVSKDDFRTIIHKNVFHLNDEQFEKIWGVLPVNEFGNLNYIDFLKIYSSEPVTRGAKNYELEVARPVSAVSRRPQTSMSVCRQRNELANTLHPRALSRSVTRLSTPLVNAKHVERELQDKIFRNWKDIQRQCRLYDPQNTGTISVYKFRDVIANKDIHLSDDQFHKLVLKYDIDGNGRLSYVNFLRHFLLTLKPQEYALNTRPKINMSKSTTAPGEANNAFFGAMLRVHDCVSSKWKEMRRVFRTIDPHGAAVVSSVDFRRVLKQFSIDLSEEEFYQMMSYYDSSMNGDIRYNDFLRAFLKE